MEPEPRTTASPAPPSEPDRPPPGPADRRTMLVSGLVVALVVLAGIGLALFSAVAGSGLWSPSGGGQQLSRSVAEWAGTVTQVLRVSLVAASRNDSSA